MSSLSGSGSSENYLRYAPPGSIVERQSKVYVMHVGISLGKFSDIEDAEIPEKLKEMMMEQQDKCFVMHREAEKVFVHTMKEAQFQDIKNTSSLSKRQKERLYSLANDYAFRISTTGTYDVLNNNCQGFVRYIRDQMDLDSKADNLITTQQIFLASHGVGAASLLTSVVCPPAAAVGVACWFVCAGCWVKAVIDSH